MEFLTSEIQNRVIEVFENRLGLNPFLNFKKYENNKASFYKDFQEKFIISKPFVSEIDNESKKKLYGDFSRLLYIRLNSHLASSIISFLDYNGIDAFFDNKVLKSTVFEGIKINKGMKLSKAMMQILSEEQFVVEDLLNAYSTYRSKMKLRGELHISIHPLDYLSMSMNNAGWRSCHALDGDYAAGTLSLMFDKTTIIAYVANPELEEINGLGIRWNSKKWRVLIHVDESRNRFILSKHYPFYSRGAETEVINMLKEIYPHMASYEITELNGDDIQNVFSNSRGRMHFSDLSGQTMSHRIAQLFSGSEHTEKIISGTSVKCLLCGNDDIVESMEFACDNCKAGSLCDICGVPHHQDNLYYVNYEEVSVCDDCFSANFASCDGCGNSYRPHDMHRSDNDLLYCERCN